MGVSIRILLIVDNADLARRLVEGLQAEGFIVGHASDGEVGHGLGLSESFDAAILDLGLPSMQGVDVLRRWRLIGCEMPVLVDLAYRSRP
jgi:two-component system, OmpR family, response regulator